MSVVSLSMSVPGAVVVRAAGWVGCTAADDKTASFGGARDLRMAGEPGGTFPNAQVVDQIGYCPQGLGCSEIVRVVLYHLRSIVAVAIKKARGIRHDA